MDRIKLDSASREYEKFIDKIAQFKKEKLELIAKYRKMVDERMLKNLRDENREKNL